MEHAILHGVSVRKRGKAALFSPAPLSLLGYIIFFCSGTGVMYSLAWRGWVGEGGEGGNRDSMQWSASL